jgi:hypothetical protein
VAKAGLIRSTGSLSLTVRNKLITLHENLLKNKIAHTIQNNHSHWWCGWVPVVLVVFIFARSHSL